MSKLPARPERPSLPEASKKPKGNSLLIVTTAVVLVLGSFTSLMVMPLVGYVPLVILAIFGFAALNYLTWGWWLTKIIQQEAEQEEAQEKRDQR